ncbi:peptidase S28 [Zopfochytrium polystomum]|nr:peptidase S28 [Zopfochytrium polystomum]
MPSSRTSPRRRARLLTAVGAAAAAVGSMAVIAALSAVPSAVAIPAFGFNNPGAIRRAVQTAALAEPASFNFTIPSAKDGFFPQKVDHFGSQTGTNGSDVFQQYYILVDQFYKPGGPIFFWIEGEGPLFDGYPRSGIVAQLAETHSGLVFALEHRFYGPNGRSSPTPDFSIESLKLLNAKQAVEDAAYFIKQTPTFFPEYKLDLSKQKVIAYGCSYAGNLASWLRDKHPDVVFAGHASSAPVKAKADFWEYSRQIDVSVPQMGPYGSKACITGWTNAVKEFDRQLDGFFVHKNMSGLQAFKDSFWMGNVRNVGDFANAVTAALASTVQYGDDHFYLTRNSTYLQTLCASGQFPAFTDPAATPAQLLDDLRGFTKFRWAVGGDVAGNNATWVAQQLNADAAGNDTSFANTNKLWTNQYCREFGYFQNAVPRGQRIEDHAVFSKYSNQDYEKWVCKVVLADDAYVEPDVRGSNAYWGGLNIKASNILFTNGVLDQWHNLGVFNATGRPQGQDVILIEEDGHHCRDNGGHRTSHGPNMVSILDKIFAIHAKWVAQ